MPLQSRHEEPNGLFLLLSFIKFYVQWKKVESWHLPLETSHFGIECDPMLFSAREVNGARLGLLECS